MFIDAINRWIKQREDTEALIMLVTNLNQVEAKTENLGRGPSWSLKGRKLRPRADNMAEIKRKGSVSEHDASIQKLKFLKQNKALSLNTNAKRSVATCRLSSCYLYLRL